MRGDTKWVALCVRRSPKVHKGLKGWVQGFCRFSMRKCGCKVALEKATFDWLKSFIQKDERESERVDIEREWTNRKEGIEREWTNRNRSSHSGPAAWFSGTTVFGLVRFYQGPALICLGICLLLLLITPWNLFFFQKWSLRGSGKWNMFPNHKSVCVRTRIWNLIFPLQSILYPRLLKCLPDRKALRTRLIIQMNFVCLFCFSLL